LLTKVREQKQVSGANIFFFTVVPEGSGVKQIFIIKIIICFADRMSKQKGDYSRGTIIT
jgi:hypothetical protein